MLKTLSIVFISFLIVIGISYAAHLKLEEVSAEGFPQKEISTKDQLKNLFAEKYARDPSIIKLIDIEETKNYVTGNVKITENPGSIGHFLAIKEAGVWQLIFDGNGNYSCEAIAVYDFLPDKITNSCY
jgi:hypothetical protein